MKEKFRIGDKVKLKEGGMFTDGYPGVGIVTDIRTPTHDYDTKYYVKWEHAKHPVYFLADDLYLYDGYEDFEDKIKDRMI